MEIAKYSVVEATTLGNDLKYWSNAAGELHHYGEYSIKEEELPKELQRAYRELWKEGAGNSYCYLAEYMGEYGIALINEFDEEYAKDMGWTLGFAFAHMLERTMEYAKMDLFKDSKIILGELSGIFDGHEFVTFVPWDASKEAFDAIADVLYKTVYEIEPASSVLEKADETKNEHEER